MQERGNSATASVNPLQCQWEFVNYWRIVKSTFTKNLVGQPLLLPMSCEEFQCDIQVIYNLSILCQEYV